MRALVRKTSVSGSLVSQECRPISTYVRLGETALTAGFCKAGGLWFTAPQGLSGTGTQAQGTACVLTKAGVRNLQHEFVRILRNSTWLPDRAAGWTSHWLPLESNLKLSVLMLKTLHAYFPFPMLSSDSTKSILLRKHLVCCKSARPQCGCGDRYTHLFS